MARELNVRALSGEIMTPGMVGPVVDADFVTVGGPKVAVEPAMREAASDAVRMAILQPAPGEAPFSRHGGPVFWACGLLVAGAAFWISGGHALLDHGGPAAPEARITALQTRMQDVAGRSILVVEGNVESHRDAALPAVLIDVTTPATRVVRYRLDGAAQRVVRYRLDGAAQRVAEGSTYAFSSRLEAPKEGVRSVAVTLEH